jgi:hypothetical protein
MKLNSENFTELNENQIKYQWFKNDEALYEDGNVSGTKTEILKIKSLRIIDEGIYKLKVTNNKKNFLLTSGDIHVNVNTLPELLCIQAYDYFGSSEDQFLLNVLYKSRDSVRKLVFYNNKGKVASNDTVYNYYEQLKHKNYLKNNFVFNKDTNELFWITIENNCGIVYSDTLNLIDDLNNFKCDPEGRITVACEGDSIVLNDEYLPISNVERFYWQKVRGENYEEGVNDNDNYFGSNSPKLGFRKLTPEDEGLYNLNYIPKGEEWPQSYGLYYLIVNVYPVILKKPTNKNVTLGNKEELVSIELEDNNDSCLTTLYKFTEKFQSPEILKAYYQKGLSFSYEKIISQFDEGFYYCTFENNCGMTISDTVFIEVISPQESLTTTIEEEKTFLFYSTPFPMPAINVVKSKIYWNSFYKIDNAKLGLYDMFGGEIPNSDITVEPINAYSAYITWNCLGFNRGVYFIRVSLGGESMTIPVLVGGETYRHCRPPHRDQFHPAWEQNLCVY